MADNEIEFESIQVRDQPPSIGELNQASAVLGLKRLFNSSGMDYRSLGMKEILPTLMEADALQLLSENGNLVKRPLVITEESAINGFKEADWVEFFAAS